jgi:lipopolysaccharide transport system permease protein
LKKRVQHCRGGIVMTKHSAAMGIRAADADSSTLVVIRRSRNQDWFGLIELWNHRNLLCLFVWRDVKVRYKQTVLGAAWAFLQPFLTMLVFTLVFGRLAKVPSGGAAYPVFFFAGLLPWQFFAQGLVRASGSLVQERYLLSKVYVPRLVLPVAAILNGMPEFGIAFVVLLGLMLRYRIPPTWATLAIIPLLLFSGATALSAGLFLAAWNVRYRDVGYIIPFFLQLWFFVTPVAYPTSLVPERWRVLYELNPMVGVMEGFRRAVLGSGSVPWAIIAVSAVCVGGLLAIGFLYFQRMDRTFADVI